MRARLTSLLLIVVLSTSAEACVAGWSSARRSCHPAPTCAKASGCGDVIRSVPGKCGLRTFVQFYCAFGDAWQSSAPLRSTAGTVAWPLNAPIIVSSIGSPQTDRGPPLS